MDGSGHQWAASRLTSPSVARPQRPQADGDRRSGIGRVSIPHHACKAPKYQPIINERWDVDQIRQAYLVGISIYGEIAHPPCKARGRSTIVRSALLLRISYKSIIEFEKNVICSEILPVCGARTRRGAARNGVPEQAILPQGPVPVPWWTIHRT
jgi:hypothetical protein